MQEKSLILSKGQLLTNMLQKRIVIDQVTKQFRQILKKLGVCSVPISTNRIIIFLMLFKLGERNILNTQVILGMVMC